MTNNSLVIDPPTETKKITSFIKTTLGEQGFNNIAIGLSGGIDSAVSLALAARSIPAKNIFVAHLYYFESQIASLQVLLKKTNIPQENIYNISIKKAVDVLAKTLFPTSEVELRLRHTSEVKRVRLGNIMARVRMTILYDLAKKHSALVCGTENKSELLLGYFTRFGDEASDFEPIQHLYKTQIYQLANYLNLPKEIVKALPSAGLWSGQTDESDFGFSYREADQVLNLHFDQKKSISGINLNELPNAQKIIDRASQNSFKHHLPYTP